MDILDLMKERHSIRQYKDKPIEDDKRKILDDFLEDVNKESNLSLQIFYDEPDCFNNFSARYGKFKNVNNYIAVVGKKEDKVRAGYFGEKLVLKCQELGLNTCWVGLTHGKSKAIIKAGEKLLILIALGYGDEKGKAHKSKPIEKLSKKDQESEKFDLGMEAVSLAPTAVNQQKFLFELINGRVRAKALMGFYTKIDLGIAIYHFEIATGEKVEY